MDNKNPTMLQIVINPNVEKILSNGTEAGNLPDGWRIVRLGEVFKFTKKPKELRYSEFEQIPFVPMDLLPLGLTSFEEFILKSNDEISSGTYFEPGDILVAKITPSFENGKQGIIENLPTPFGIATTEVIPLKEVEGISDKYYLFYYLLRQDIRNDLAGKMEGSTGRQRLSVTTLAGLELPFPPLPQQQAIAKVLQTVQEAIQARRGGLELERERKAALMEYLFTQGAHNEPLKQTEIGKIPQNWDLKQYGDICQTISVGIVVRPSSYYVSSGVPAFRSLNVREDRLSTKDLVFVSKEDNESVLAKSRLRAGDVLIVRTGEPGTSCVVPAEYDRSNCIDIIFARPDAALMTSEFMSRFMNTSAAKKQAFKARIGLAQQHLNVGAVQQIVIPVPPLKEQYAIVEVLQLCDTLISAIEDEILVLEELFHVLLEELMTGRLSTLPLIEEGGEI